VPCRQHIDKLKIKTTLRRLVFYCRTYCFLLLVDWTQDDKQCLVFIMNDKKEMMKSALILSSYGILGRFIFVCLAHLSNYSSLVLRTLYTHIISQTIYVLLVHREPAFVLKTCALMKSWHCSKFSDYKAINWKPIVSSSWHKYL